MGAGKLIFETRNRLQEILHCKNKQIIFTPTATIALNMILQGVIYRIGCRAIRDCLSQVEFLGGGIYIAQLFVVVALL